MVQISCSTVTMGEVCRCSNITKYSNAKIQNAILEVSKGYCIVMGDINHGNVQWNTQESTGIEDERTIPSLSMYYNQPVEQDYCIQLFVRCRNY